MINTGFCWSSYRLVALVMWLLASPQMALAQEDVIAPIPADLATEYHQCHKVLWSYPLTTLKDFVPKGYGARLSTGYLKDHVKGLHCSDEQIIEYMEHHGLPYEKTRETQKLRKDGHGTYNRLINFCVKSPKPIDRIIFGRCGGVTRFLMWDDKISDVISHGKK